MKKPQKVPAVGDRVKLRGRAPEGILKAFGKDPTWVHVDWKDGGPKWCHINELEKIES